MALVISPNQRNYNLPTVLPMSTLVRRSFKIAFLKTGFKTVSSL